jgi:hypothetical protein
MIDFNMTSHVNHKPRFRRLRWALAACLWAAALAALVPAGRALAQEEEIKRDARLEGYATKVYVDSDSTALTWILLIFLGMITLSVMFKNAKRTHLD